MTYSLSKLAAGSYDVILNGVIIARLVRSDVYGRAHRYRPAHPCYSTVPKLEAPPNFRVGAL